MLFSNWERFKKYIYCIFIGAPLWYVVGVLVFLSPEFGKQLGAPVPLIAGTGVKFTYIGISAGGIIAGVLAQITHSRKLTMMIFLLASVVSVAFYLSAKGITQGQFEWLCFFMGCSVGYWATFVTIASEQFGTNIRATVTTTVPNFVRGLLIPISMLFNVFAARYSMIKAGYIMMFLLTAIALFSLSQLKESFTKDLNYVEAD